MTTSNQHPRPIVDIPTTIALGVIAAALNVGIHEGAHALACTLSGGELISLTALSAECEPSGEAARRLIAFAGPLVNLLIGAVLYVALRRRSGPAGTTWYFLWLFMLVNWLYGTGYFLFSGVAGVGDMAAVIAGWSPSWLWRVLLVVVGAAVYLLTIRLSLNLFGERVGGTADEQIGRANRMAVWSYVGAVLAVAVAGLFNPAGLLSLPVTAGLAAVVFGLSPLLWMMQWFRAAMFAKQPGAPLEIGRSWPVIAAAGVALLVYGVWLGRGLLF